MRVLLRIGVIVLLAAVIYPYQRGQTSNLPATYALQMALSQSGRTLAGGLAFVKEGEATTIAPPAGRSGRFMEAVAREPRTPSAPGNILISFTVGSVDASGNRLVLTHSEIQAPAGEAIRLRLADNLKLHLLIRRTLST